MDAKQLFALFIVVIMAASTIGFAVLYKTPDQEQDSGGDNGETPVQPTAIDFQADNVDATAQQILPSVKIVAETTQTDISALHAAIYAIKGVKRVSGWFQQMEGTTLGTGFVFVADISFGKDYNAEYILDALQSQVGLQNIKLYNHALIKVPAKIKFTSVNTDLNISMDGNFSENLMEGLVNFSTITGDKLKVSITATFVGTKPTNQNAYETENVSATPIQKEVSLSAPVASLEKRLRLSGTVAYSQQAATEGLAEEIKAIAGVLDANVSAPPAQPLLFIESQVSASDGKFADLNAFLYALGAESVSAENSPVYATLSFGEGTAASEITAKKYGIENKLRELDVNASVSESNGLLSGRVELASADSRQAGEAIKNLLAGKGMEAMVRQPGYITLQEVFDPETGATYSIDLNSVSAFLAPGKAIGQDVSVQITYYIVRGKIASIQAFENE